MVSTASYERVDVSVDGQAYEISVLTITANFSTSFAREEIKSTIIQNKEMITFLLKTLRRGWSHRYILITKMNSTLAYIDIYIKCRANLSC